MLRHLLVASLLAALLAAPVGAEEAAAPDPAPPELAQLRRASFPADDGTAGFQFDGYVLRAGRPYGRVHLGAGRKPDAPGWHVRDAIDPVDPAGERVHAAGMLANDLSTTGLQYVRRNAQGFLRASVEPRDGGGYRIEHVTNDYENRLDVAGARPLATLSGLVLFLRLVPARPAVYELPDLDPNPAAGNPYVAPARIQIHRTAPWRVKGGVRSAWIVSYTRGTQTLRLALDAKDRSLLGVEYVGLPFQFVPKGSGPVGLAEGVAPGLMTPVERAVARTRALRAKLPAPSAADAFDVRARVRLGAVDVGEAWLRAQPAAHGGVPAWSVLDSRVIRTGESVVEAETSGTLAADLSLRRGDRIRKRPAGWGRATYERAEGGMRVVGRGPAGVGEPQLLAAAPDASAGLPAVLLFLRHVPSTPQHYLLPGWDPRFAGKLKAGSGAFAFHAADVHIRVRGLGDATIDGAERQTLQANCRLRNGTSYDVHLDPESRSLLAVLGHMPTTSLVVSKAPLRRPDWYDAVDGVPQSARQAFIKFGRGYHRPREDLLAEAFHWPSLVEQAIAAERYPKDTPLERIRKDWIDTFVGMSKHRTKGDCDDLLFQILMTSREVTNDDGSVTLHTLPVYGGHSYRMAERDGRWVIVAID